MMNTPNPELIKIVHLVEALYSSKDPNEVLEIQKELQNIQKSPAGWEVANLLLSVDSINCKFFGALTYTVNINLHFSDISPDRALKIISELLYHLIALISNAIGNVSFLVRKILSNLALMFIYFHDSWNNPLLSLARSLHDTSPHISSLNEPVPMISKEVAELVLLFSQIIVEELLRSEGKNNLFQIVHENVFTLTSQLLFTNDLYLRSLDCLNSWIQYISTSEYNSAERYDITNPLSILLDLVVSDDVSISSRAIDVTIETLETKPSFFNKTLKEKIDSIIFSPWSIQYIKNSREIEDYDNINNFSRLVTLYLETDVLNFASTLLNPAIFNKVEFLLSLTDFPAVPIDEELLSKDFLEFWSELGEIFIDDTDRLSIVLKKDPDRLLALNSKMFELFNKVCFIYWKKIRIPTDNFASYRTQFMSYRRDVSDFFDLAYPIVKESFFENLISNILSNISEAIVKFDEIEASLYTLTSVSSNFSYTNPNTTILNSLSKLFQSPFLQALSSHFQQNTTTFAIDSLIHFLSAIDFFYKLEQGIPFLPSIMSFLFDCIINSTMYNHSSSKAIAKISDECRLSLGDYLPNFQNILVEMINNPSFDSTVRERITNAYASIIQGTKNLDNQAKHLLLLLELVQQRIDNLYTEGCIEKEADVEYIISLLNCISELGKGMQLPDEIEEYLSEEEINHIDQYWSQDPYGIHQMILSIIGKVSLNESQNFLLKNTEVVEKCCLILKRGLTETTGGPFTLNVKVIVDFIVAKFPMTSSNGLHYLFQLMELLVLSSHMKMSFESISKAVDYMLFRNIEYIKADPDLMECSISMVAVIIEKKPNLVIFSEQFPKILELCLEGISTKEKFILKASSKFWSRIIVLKKGDKADHEHISNLFINENLGLILTHTTLINLLPALRSNIEYYQEILKFLVVKYPLQLKIWLVDSFVDISNKREAENLKPLQRTDLLIKKMMATRGKGHQFMTVIKEFWLESNGLTNY